jgi:hypothetical protein
MVFFVLLILTGCSDRTGIPNDIIPPDSMQSIMKDVIMAEEYSTLFIIHKDSLNRDKVKANQDLLETVFKIHHTTKESFRASLRFYESRPDLNKKIFDSLSAYANRHRSELYMSRPLPKPGILPVK